ncbi:D-alanyl-D-alanine carboxypeptidase/D-alanyl-D-alanine-endopeptidase [Bifidobacterium biavatii DSM 23969]|uniref:D-alanyl-D-alanine carboxypeptidase/D-alanyl-D-alanine-endopeptidase n=1 Tax=Bifidobacterium biavatii DSM 23969 TaxID=1437608 RepID=A0A087A2Q0_9BIFI|nr:D-alanyl-D-alanine carboxypeptidase [Bifidobacterium biavatii]KFI53050.1 D-alanyl-D-alanine carboxypeptidase/D-alanyl-D-alanine-endopeptidase [Bifidobacterium biavatii DSM 23969]
MQDGTTQQPQRGRCARRRTINVAVSAIVTVALCAGYVALDIADLAPGPLTMRQVTRRTIPNAPDALAAGSVAGTLDATRAVDKSAAAVLISAFGKTGGVGDSYSVIITDANGDPVAQRNADTPREPASTMKTLTALAASSTLDMGTTLDTQTYLIQHDDGSASLVLKGNGDMLLGSGTSDPDHVNGRAGLATLAARTATALKARGIGTVTLTFDDALFGNDRYPDGIDENNEGDLYYTGVSSMAIDGGRQWDGGAPTDPDTFSAYPRLSQHTAEDAADVFVDRLAEQGITVNGDVTDGTAPSDSSPIASVSSATLAEILAFALQHSDNTLAEEFGRLTAIKLGEDNSPKGGVAAVRKELGTLGVDTTGLTMADCSGLTPGSKLTVRTLAAVQAHNLSVSGGAAAAEGLSIPGLVGTALNRAVSEDTAGLLRVKTGSLGEVTSMTGNVSRIGGGALAFAVIVNKPDDMTAARAAIDQFVDDLARL